MSKGAGYFQNLGGVSALDAAASKPAAPTQSVSRAAGIQTAGATSTAGLNVASAHKAGAYSQATDLRKTLNTASDSIAASRQQFVDQMKDLQNEISQAAVAGGHDPAEIFPDTRIAPNTTIELAMSALSNTPAFGKGSMITAALKNMDNLSTLDAIIEDRKGRTPEEIQSEIADILRQSAAGPQQGGGDSALIMDAPETDIVTIKGTRGDWDNAIEQYPEALSMIMSFDEDCYDPERFPELAALDEAAGSVEKMQAEVGYVLEHAVDAPGGDMDPKSAAEVEMWSESLGDTRGAQFSENAASMQLCGATTEVKAAFANASAPNAALANEMDPLLVKNLQLGTVGA